MHASPGAVGRCAPRHAGVANSWGMGVVMVAVMAMMMAPVIVSDRPRRNDLFPIVISCVWLSRETHGAVVSWHLNAVDYLDAIIYQ